jgi:hypothetical protein
MVVVEPLVMWIHGGIWYRFGEGGIVACVEGFFDVWGDVGVGERYEFLRVEMVTG